MSDGFPSMTALLGLLALAGFQNRDKIAEMLDGVHPPQPGGAAPASPGAPGNLGGLLGGVTGVGAGGFLGGGIGQLVEQFRQNGHGPAVDSWVNHGPNHDIAPQHLQQAIGPDVLDTLSRQTGLSRDELLARLARELPSAVDRYPPDGRLPAH